jgi:hypothetical protein
MTKVVIVLDAEGNFEAVLTDSEIEVKVLKRESDDNEIDKAESELEQVEI